MSNGSSVEVEINDRGPFVEGRILDVSRAAAHALGFISAGTAPVRLELLDQPLEASAAR
jgi:rare lipoprotein A